MGVEPTSTGLQPAAWPSGSSVSSQVARPGIEPGLRPSQGRVQSNTLTGCSTSPGSRTPSCRFEVCRAHPSHSQGLGGADDWIRTSMIRFTRPAPAYSATSAKHERKESNPVRQFWRLTALPGAHSHRQGDRAESNRRQADSQSASGNQHRIWPQRLDQDSNLERLVRSEM